MWRKLLATGLIVFLIWAWATGNLGSVLNSAFTQIRYWQDSVFSTPERQRLMALRDDFLRNNMSLQPYQTDYIVELTEQLDSVKNFHRLYCVTGDRNPYLFGANLHRFCELIDQSGVLSMSK